MMLSPFIIGGLKRGKQKTEKEEPKETATSKF